MFWQEWWVWVAAGFALGVLEVMLPGYMFLGFAIGSILTGILVATGLVGENLAILLAIFGAASAVAWIALVRYFGNKKGQVKIWDRDINDNP
jgi:inner membrane protein